MECILLAETYVWDSTYIYADFHHIWHTKFDCIENKQHFWNIFCKFQFKF